MMAGMEHVWRRHRAMVLAFVLAALLTAMFGIRLGVHAVYWSRHREVALAPWMTLGYVAKSWDLERDDLARALGVEPGSGRKLTLTDLARLTGRPESEVEETLRAAIAAARERQAAEP